MVARKIKPILVIVGETASGKSEVALNIAKELDGEIICADSWTVYKGFNIGTAKPRSKDLQLFRHHMIDVADPNKGFSAAEFKRLAKIAIEDIQKRGKLPILVGGSGLYIDSIIFDYSFMPAGEINLRVKYNSMKLSELQKIVNDLGYDTTDIDMNNKRRIIRLIENNGIKPKSKPLLKNTVILGIKIDKLELDKNIKDRVEKMFANGLESEVRDLSSKYGWDIEPMKGIGYREFKDYFNGINNLSKTQELIIKNTLNLAKKQRTWFRRNNSIQWVTNSKNIVLIATTNLNKLSGK